MSLGWLTISSAALRAAGPLCGHNESSIRATRRIAVQIRSAASEIELLFPESEQVTDARGSRSNRFAQVVIGTRIARAAAILGRAHGTTAVSVVVPHGGVRHCRSRDAGSARSGYAGAGASRDTCGRSGRRRQPELAGLGRANPRLQVARPQPGLVVAGVGAQEALESRARRGVFPDCDRRQSTLRDVQRPRAHLGRVRHRRRARGRHGADALGEQGRLEVQQLVCRAERGTARMPQIVGGRLVTADSAGRLSSLEKQTGKVVWSHDSTGNTAAAGCSSGIPATRFRTGTRSS